MAKFCGKCGARLSKRTGRCPNCSRKLRYGFGCALKKIAVIFFTTVLMLACVLYGMLYMLAKGPSPTAQNIFVRSVRETSAIGFLAEWFFSEEEIEAMYAQSSIEEDVDTDTSLITIQDQHAAQDSADQSPSADAWGLVDEDGDGIIIEPVRGEGYSGYMMVVLDPGRVSLGAVPDEFGVRGYTVGDMAQKFDAVAAINAGGFEDPDGQGNGSVPDTMVVYQGETYYERRGTRQGFAALDKDHILHVGNISGEDVKNQNIQYGVGFGPVLISNGEPADPAKLSSGVNPRTAIGQRSDGAILMLVIDGRQVISLGATYQDLVDIFLEYGAVNACNLDGGSSSMMWFNGEYINNCASVIGLRPVPTTFIVLKEGGQDNEK